MHDATTFATPPLTTPEPAHSTAWPVWLLYTNAPDPLPAPIGTLPCIDKLLLDPVVGVTLPTDDALHVPIGAWPPPPGTTVLLAQKLMAPVFSLTENMPYWVCCEMWMGGVEVL